LDFARRVRQFADAHADTYSDAHPNTNAHSHADTNACAQRLRVQSI
jgi:hypothetical protein